MSSSQGVSMVSRGHGWSLEPPWVVYQLLFLTLPFERGLSQNLAEETAGAGIEALWKGEKEKTAAWLTTPPLVTHPMRAVICLAD